MSKSKLFSPITLRGLTLKNRIVVSPMCLYSAVDGIVNDWHFVHYGALATGGPGLLMVEGTAIEPKGRYTLGCAGLWKDEQIEPWGRVVNFIKSQGVVAGVQISHAGRKGSITLPWTNRGVIPEKEGGWDTVGPSPVKVGDKVLEGVSLEEIEEIKKAWVAAAKRGVKAGFEVIELQYAHGVLVSSFLFPVANTRTDKYGGSLENRMRLGLEIAEMVRKELPENIVLGVRISVADAEGGWDVDQSIEFTNRLKQIGVDFIDCLDWNILISDGDYKPMARVLKETGMVTGAVGKISDPLLAEKLLQDEAASLIFVGRAFLDNPHWPYLAADVLADADSFKYPPQYDWAVGWKGFAKWRGLIRKEEIDKN